MSNDKPKDRYNGSKFTVIHCEGALESYEVALNSVEAGKHKSFTRGMIMQIQRLADGHRLSKENFPQEGNLPGRKGRQKAKKFYALKRIPIRGYCWKSGRRKNTYYISHYVYKDYDNLKERDAGRVGANWSRIEEKGDER
ncbi:MAG: hypothetical protein KZQ76_13845 [Candidatus Thiodiazotropha sp. (ex Epidulcina cf. delphinae)]|nr:hypothetical protein [Candidatus Thiodiazotropha sp. (ex Epidulcina cf. delphinae)]